MVPKSEGLADSNVCKELFCKLLGIFMYCPSCRPTHKFDKCKYCVEVNENPNNTKTFTIQIYFSEYRTYYLCF